MSAQSPRDVGRFVVFGVFASGGHHFITIFLNDCRSPAAGRAAVRFESTMTIERVASASARHGGSELRRIDYLDGWRGLAIFLVLQGHFFAIQGWHSGRMGVDIFFCLSGLLVNP